MKHTPGPWKYDGQEAVYPSAPIEAPTCLPICHVSYEQSERSPANLRRIVACVNACEGIVDPSAVPEMLDELKNCHRFFTMPAYGEGHLYKGWRTRLEAVIAKAEGSL